MQRIYSINWDSDIRSTSQIKTHIAKYELMPFDGIILDAYFTHAQVSTAQRLSSWALSDYLIDWPSLSASLTDLQTTPFRKFSHNFLLIKMTTVVPYVTADWYSKSIDSVLWNIRIAARFAERAGLKGLFLDLEPDNHLSGRKIFNYSDRPFTSTYSFIEYQNKVKEVSSLMVQVIQDEYPDMDLVISFGYEQAIKQNNPPKPTDDYGLLYSFLQGLFETAIQPLKIHNYYEDGYYHFSDAQINRDLEIPNAFPYPSTYKQGFASYVDGLGDTNLNEVLKKTIERVTYKYSFTYKRNTPFMASDGSTNVAAPTVQAIRDARISTGLESPFNSHLIPGIIADFNPQEMGLNDGDSVISYTDYFGITYSQSDPSKCPVYKADGMSLGVPGIEFKTSQLIISGLIEKLIGTSDIPLSVFISFKPNVLGVNAVLMGLGRTSITNPEISFHQSSTNFVRWSIADNAGGNSTITGTGTTLDTNPHIGSWIYSGKVLNMRQDGSNVLPTTQYATYDYGLMTLDQAVLGSNARNTNAFFCDAVIGRVIICNAPVSLQTARWIEQGLAAPSKISIKNL